MIPVTRGIAIAEEELEEETPDAEPAVSPATPEGRAPVTTEYVRGQGKRNKRRKR